MTKLLLVALLCLCVSSSFADDADELLVYVDQHGSLPHHPRDHLVIGPIDLYLVYHVQV